MKYTGTKAVTRLSTLALASTAGLMVASQASAAGFAIGTGTMDNIQYPGTTVTQMYIPVPPMVSDYPATGKIDSHALMVTSGWAKPDHSSPQNMLRYYFVYVPQSYKPGKPAPLVIVLHGGGLDLTAVLKPSCHSNYCAYPSGAPPGGVEAPGYGASVWATSSPDPGVDWSTLAAATTVPAAMAQSFADKYGILIAVPNGSTQNDPNPLTAGSHYNSNGTLSYNYWNDCSGNNQGYTDSNNNPIEVIDDVGFITQMVQKMKRPVTQQDAFGAPGDGYSIDANRVYVTGASNGGDMAHRLAREMANVAAAGFSLGSDGASGNLLWLKVQDNCTSTLNSQNNPVPIWMYKGQNDHAVPYYGGQSMMNLSSWYIPYEPFPAGYPQQSNAFNNINTGGITFVGQMLGRYGMKLPGTAPVLTVYGYNTNPHRYKTDNTPNTTPMGSRTADGDGTVWPQNPPTDSTINCDKYVNTNAITVKGSTPANPRAQVTNCVASNAGHIEASWAAPAAGSDMILVGAQNLDIETTTEYWNFFQHFTLTSYTP